MQTGYKFVISYACKEPSGVDQENSKTLTTLILTLRFLGEVTARGIHIRLMTFMLCNM